MNRALNCEQILCSKLKPVSIQTRNSILNTDFGTFRPRHSANRKDITKRSRCMWLDKDVHKCVEERHKEKKASYRTLSKATGMAVSTIWTKYIFPTSNITVSTLSTISFLLIHWNKSS